MKLAVLLAMLAGLSIAVQATFNATAARTLGLPVLVSLSGFATGLTGLVFAVFGPRPEFTSRAVVYVVASGLLGCVILACVTYAVGVGGVARALSLVVASQLIAGLVFDALGFFGAEISILKLLGAALIVVGGFLVVRF